MDDCHSNGADSSEKGKGQKKRMRHTMMMKNMKKDHSDCLCHYDKMMMKKKVQELGVRKKVEKIKKNIFFLHQTNESNSSPRELRTSATVIASFFL